VYKKTRNQTIVVKQKILCSVRIKMVQPTTEQRVFNVLRYINQHIIDNSHYRLILKLGKEMQINHHSSKEHTKMSKIAKFGCEML
jgi:hypothetical protein